MLQELNAYSATPVYPLGFAYRNGDDVWRYAHIHPLRTGGRGRPMLATDQGIERGTKLGIQVSGAKTVAWTCVATVLADQYKDGYLLCQGGFVHKIKSNTPGIALDVITLTLYDTFAAWEAIAAGRYGLLLENPYANVAPHSICNGGATGAGLCVGICTGDAPADKYVWLKTSGPCGVIATPATLGDVEGEIALCVGQHVGDEVGITTGHGKQIIGHSMPCAAINWDNENFMILDLCIKG